MVFVELKDYAQVVVAIIAIGSFVVAMLQLWLLLRQLKFQYDWNKKEKALEYSLSKNKNLQEVRRKLDSLFGNIHHNSRVIPYDEIINKLEEDNTSYTVITSLLAHWENMALAIHQGIVDEDVAYEMTAGLVIDYVRAFQNFIDERQNKNNARAYAYLVPLSKDWKTRREGSIQRENESLL